MKKKISIPAGTIEKKVAALPNLHKAAIFLGTLIVLGVAFYFLSYKPQSETIGKLQRTVTQQERRLEELKRAAREVKKLQGELVEAEKRLEELLALLPEKKEIPGLLENVTRLGAQEGLENVLFQPQNEKQEEFYASIPVRLDLIGNYHDLGRFFDKISRLDRILKVERLNLVRQGGEDSKIKVNFVLETYRFLKESLSEQPEDQKGKQKGKKEK
jgi:type IV pilus assembly protein PilO